MRRPLRVVYADHSRLEHHGLAAADVAVCADGKVRASLRRISILECVKFSPWGRVSAPAGVAPKAMEECLHSSRGYKRRPAWLIDWGDCPASFSAGLGVPFSWPRRFPVLIWWPAALLINPEGVLSAKGVLLIM